MKQNLDKARKAKNDEFYTMYEDIEKEISCYPSDTWKDKVVYCNCDDPSFSNFWKYFVDNFKKLNLKELHATYIENGGCSQHWMYDGNEVKKLALKGNGDFRSAECMDILKQCDIVVTNPPFSLFREYVDLLIMCKVDFLVMGNLNAVNYRNVFPHIKNGVLKVGYNNSKKLFLKSNGSSQLFNNVIWYTTLDKVTNPILLTRKFDPARYEKFDNYDAINVDKVKDIPCDYYGVMGVPITFLLNHDSRQFKIVGVTEQWAESINEIPTINTYEDYVRYTSDGVCLNKSSKGSCNGKSMLKGKGNKCEYHIDSHGNVVHQTYKRILIKRHDY